MRRIARTPLLGALAGLLAFAIPAEAATGLDPSYGDEGVATLMVPDPYNGELEPMISFFGDVDESGRVVRGSLGSDQVMRLAADGAPDPTFGGGDGLADLIADIGVIDATDDGVVIGARTADGGVVMLDPDGSPAEWWGDDGNAALTAPGATSEARIVDVDLAPDGSVYVMAGGVLGGPMSVHRLLPDGSVDEDFGVGGSVVRDEAHIDSRIFEGLDATGSGVVFVRNVVPDPEDYEHAEAVVEHLYVSGEPHEEFGVGGQVRIPGGALAIDVDERDYSIFVGGADADGAAVWHLEWNGRLDARFAAGPGVPGDGRVVWDVEALGDGRVVAAAEGTTTTQAIVLRPDGQPDPAFGPNGGQSVAGDPPIGGAVGVGSDGRILLYTRAANDQEEARAFLTELAGLAPAVTDVTPHARSLSVEWTGAEVGDLPPVRIWQVMAFGIEGELVGQSVVAGDVRQASIEGLDPRHQHHVVMVRPYDDFGPGITSGIFPVVADASAPPAGPAPAVPDIGVTAGNGFVQVQWDPVPDDGGSTVWGYSVVAVRTSDGALAGWRNVRADVRAASMPGLTNGTGYTFYVIAVTSEGFGAVSTPLVTVPVPTGQPAPPEMSWVSVVPTGASAVVTWGPATERGEVTSAVHVIVIEDGVMTQWKAMTSFDRQVVVPAGPGAQVYVIAQSASGFGPLTGPIVVTP